MHDPERVRRREAQRRELAACRAAMPPALALLWETILHAPPLAFDGAVDALRAAYSEERARLAAILAWHGHGDGSCPVCRMFVASLVFSLPEPIRLLGEVLRGEPTAAVRRGAERFRAERLHARYALPAGVSRARFAELSAQAAELPPSG